MRIQFTGFLGRYRMYGPIMIRKWKLKIDPAERPSQLSHNGEGRIGSTSISSIAESMLSERIRRLANDFKPDSNEGGLGNDKGVLSETQHVKEVSK